MSNDPITVKIHQIALLSQSLKSLRIGSPIDFLKKLMNIESVEIEGQLKKPQGSLISEQNSALFNPLVNPRSLLSSFSHLQ